MWAGRIPTVHSETNETTARNAVSRSTNVRRRRNYQLPPPPPPPPPPEKPPPPNPLPLPELGGADAMALDRLEFIDSRLLERSAAWNGTVPTYQPLLALVSIPSKAFAHRDTQPNTIAYGRSWVKISPFSANCCLYFSAVFM